MSVKRIFQPRPLTLGRPTEFRLDDQESPLFDSIAQEVNAIAATTIDFYHLDLVKTIKDPLYDEASERKFRGPYQVKALVTYPQQDPHATKDGTTLAWDSTAWIARADLEACHAPAPNIGDVIRIWKVPFYNKDATFDETIPNGGFYFNVINVNPDGNLFDTPTFVGFRLTLTRRTDFTPERRLTNT